MRDTELADSLENAKEPSSSAVLLDALEDAGKKFSAYNTFCQKVDDAFTLSNQTDFLDNHFALFWASMEILKPALYAKPPKPISSPRFKDANTVAKTVSELIERCLESEFDRGDMDSVMLEARDDLALSNRGVAWVTLEDKHLCIEHLDRLDFRHEPARKWAEVGWVARRAWMTKTQMKDRFEKHSGDAYEGADFQERRDKDQTYGSTDSSAKAGVWEIWSRVDNKVYWVTESVQKVLDESDPHLNLSGFFPCPKPAYGTRQRRTLIPVPDYKQYAPHLSQINDLTARIYVLLNQVKLKVLIPAGGDIGTAVETALSSDDDTIVIPVPAAALMGAGTGGIMITLPLADIAQTIQGLIEARGQLIEDFYQLSGISDIMRGATEAQETLGAQQLKSQYGSVRVRDKIDELQRLARDIARISAEIISENFSEETLLETSQMTIPKRAEVDRKTKEVEKASKDAMNALKKEFEDNAAAQTEEVNPEEVKKAFMQKQQEIMAQYSPVLRQLGETVVIEDVMKMLRDEKVRNLVIDIETDSTIMTDEMAEKQSRNDFLMAFNSAAQTIMPLMQAGEPGAKLGGGILKFALQPYRANRELDDLVDDFVSNAGNLPTGEDGNAEQQALVAAQNKLAEAEMAKAQAQTMKVQADAQAKMQEIQLKASEAQAKAQGDQQKLMLEVEKTKAQTAEVEARIEKVFAEIQKMGIDASNQTRQQDREDIKTVSDIEARQVDQAMSQQDRQRQAMEGDRSAAMAERQQGFSEKQGQSAEQRADRQQSFAERQAQRPENQ